LHNIILQNDSCTCEYYLKHIKVLNHSSYDPLPQKSLEDTLKEFMEITGQSTIQVLQPESSLEDTLKEFMENTSQTMQELKNVTMVDSSAIREIEDPTMANTSAIQRLEGQLNHLVAEFNRLEEEEFQSQLMAEGHYMIDEDDSSYLHYEHAQATTTFGSEVVFEKIINEPSLEDPFEESSAQFKFDLDFVPKQDEALLDSTPEIRPENGETTEISFPNTSSSAAEKEEKGKHLEYIEHLEHLEHTEPLPYPNMSTDKEMSTEAHSFITIPLETFMSPKFQFFNVSKYHLLLKASRIDAHKIKNLGTIILRRSFEARKLAT
jgi:hypothetical protein